MGYERNDRNYGRDRYDYEDDRGFIQRAGDEVRSWFGDEEAERRRRLDERYDERFDRDRDRGYDRYAGDDGFRERGGYGRSTRGANQSRDVYPHWYRSNGDDTRREYAAGGYAGYDRDFEARRHYARDDEQGRRSDYTQAARDYGRQRTPYGEREHDESRFNHRASADHDDYQGWRNRQISAFDRDYDEYRQENRSRFESEFASWRQNRQTQRDSLRSVKEHQEVVGSDGQHVGKVDHVRNDNILLTKTDRDAGGHHHTIPSSWIVSVDDKVHLSKTADEAKTVWRNAEQRGLFGDDRNDDTAFEGGGYKLNRSFSGTY